VHTILKNLHKEELTVKYINYLTLAIAIIGAVNWGLIGFFNFNLVSLIFGDMTWMSRIIYALVGICGLYLLTFYSMLQHRSQN